MPTFTFTSPDGKNYSVDGPEGATKEQAFEILQKQLSGTQPGADTAPGKEAAKQPNMQSPQMAPGQGAQPDPEAKPPDQRSLGGAARDIGTSGIVGGVLGAFAPEIMQGLSVAAAGGAALFPPAAPLLIPAAEALGTMGTALRGARVAEAAVGAIGGLTSETAGQLAEAGGAGKTAAFGARVLGGGLAGPASEMAAYVPKGAKAAFNLVRGVTGSEAAGSTAAVKAAQETLASKALAGKPQLDMYAALQQGVIADTKAADAAASAHIAEATKRAQTIATTDQDAAKRVMDDANAYAHQLRAEAASRAQTLTAAAKGKLATASRVQSMADSQLSQTVGPTTMQLSDIGTAIRSRVTGEQQTALAKRAEDYTNTVQARDVAVAEKENAGKFMDSEPGMKAFKQDLSTKLLNTKAGRAAAQGKAAVTDQGMTASYQKVYDAVMNKRVQTGIDPETGAPTFQTFKTTFDAVDAVRRKLGDVAFGKEAEGYTALGQAAAKDMYGKLAKIQEDYAGAAQKKLQSDYHDATLDLGKFGTSASKKVTAVDRSDPEAFLKDPASLPAQYFRSAQGVRDLQSLTGNNAEVATLARGYAANQLRGKSTAQVQTWLNSPQQRDWVREVPGLQGDLDRYVTKLGQIEQVAGKLTERAGGMQKEAQVLPRTAEQKADKAVEDARKEASARVGSRVDERANIVKEATDTAGKAREAAVKTAQAVVHNGYPEEAVKSLLLNGSPSEISAATRYMAQQPGGKEALEGSVRQTLRTVPAGKVGEVFRARIMPALKDGGLVSPARLEKLQKDVAAVTAAYEGKPPLKLVQKMVLSAMGGAGGGMVARGEDFALGE